MMLDPFLKSQPPAYRHRLETCVAFYWIYLRRGTLSATWGGRTHRLNDEDCLLLPVGAQVDLSTSANKGYEGVSITVLPPDSDAWAGAHPIPLRPSTELGRLARMLEAGLDGAARRPMAYCRHLARALLEETRFLLAKPSPQARTLGEAIVDEVEEDLRRSIYSGDRVAKVLDGKGLSPRQVERLFKARHGQSAKAWLMDRKLEQARLWLARPGRSAAALADELGFSSAQHFISWYRNKTGRTPMRGS